QLRWTIVNLATAPLRRRFLQSAFFDHKGCDLVYPLTALQIRKDERSFPAHSQRVRFHYLKVRAYQGSQINFVDHQEIGACDARAALARYFFSFSNIDHIDRQVLQLGAEGCSEIVAA